MRSAVIVIKYGVLESHPPVMTLLLVLKRLGRNVHYIGLESKSGRRFLEENGIPFDFLQPYKSTKNYLTRAFLFYKRRRLLFAILDKLKNHYGSILPWFQECHSAALAGDGVYSYGRGITTFFEYNLNYGARWFGFDFKRMMQENVIVECELNRAFMTQAVHGLKDTPLVVVNKPLIDSIQISDIPLEAKVVFDKIGSRPVFLYQGYLAKDRADVPFMLEVIAKNRPDYCVVCLTSNTDIQQRLSKYENAFVLESITAPGHLSVTSRATVGVAAYNGEGGVSWYLNAIYCAPNKIYEYAAFGVPTLCNRIPGLIYSIGVAQAGICCELKEDSILNAADELVNKIDFYSRNALKFYNDVDLEKQIQAVLRRAEGGI